MNKNIYCQLFDGYYYFLIVLKTKRFVEIGKKEFRNLKFP